MIATRKSFSLKEFCDLGSSYRLQDALKVLQPNSEDDYLGRSSSSDRADYAWDLSTDFPSACRLAARGWIEKASELKHFDACCERKTSSNSKPNEDLQFDTVGMSVDIGRFLEGEPECMTQLHSHQTFQSINVIVDIGTECKTRAEYYLNRGLAIASVIRSLQRVGHDVSLSAISLVGSKSTRRTHLTEIIVNEPEEYISAARVAFWLGHPAALRRCIFRLDENNLDGVRREFGFHVRGGYGVPIRLSGKPKDSVYIRPLEVHRQELYASPKSALQEVRNQFKEQGIEF